MLRSFHFTDSGRLQRNRSLDRGCENEKQNQVVSRARYLTSACSGRSAARPVAEPDNC